MTPVEIASWLNGFRGDAVVAVDAPLVVGEGRRAEAELRESLGGRGIMAYHVGGDFLERKGLVAGPELGRQLGAAGWTIGPPGRPQARGRFVFETFPRALTVTLLGAEKPPAYKRGPLAERLIALDTYRELVQQAAAERHLRLDVEAPGGDGETACLTGRAVKDIEDRLDAAVCALAAWTVAIHGTHPHDRFGTPELGEIVVPGARSSSATSAREPTSP
jgi:predicted RNase H-like nuclease